MKICQTNFAFLCAHGVIGFALAVSLLPSCSPSDPSGSEHTAKQKPPVLPVGKTPLKMKAAQSARTDPDRGAESESKKASKAPWVFNQPPTPPKIEPSDFVGAAVCGSCHKDAYETWQTSAHGRAGTVSSVNALIPKVDGRKLQFSDGYARLDKKGKVLTMTVHFNGRQPLHYVIESMVGRGLMHGGGAQTFFYRADDGRSLLLPMEYNIQEKVWYCQTQTEKKWAVIDGSFSLRDCGFPPSRALGNVPDGACQNCHGSQIQVVFDTRAGQFQTRFTDLHINCESCHGPGRRHVELMKTGAAGTSEDIGLEPLALKSTRDQVLVCMNCHGTKPDIGLGYVSGHDFDDYFSNLLMGPPMSRHTHFDGRITDFGYQQGHLFSACYTDGSMTCVDCHGPHGLKYRDIYGVAMPGRYHDNQCIDCHPSKHNSQHSRHPQGSEAARCTSCHMPSHQLGAVGQQIPHERADHAIPIPRPVHDKKLGIKTPCERCHKTDSTDVIQGKMDTLFGQLKPLPKLTDILFAYSRKLGRTEVPRGGHAERMILEDLASKFTGESPLAAIYAMTYLVGELLVGERAAPSSEAVSGLWRATASSDLDVKSAALTTILFFADASPQWRTRIQAVLKNHDHQVALRRKIAAHLVGIDRAFSPINDSIRTRIARRLMDDGLEVAPQKYEILPALGASFLARGDTTRAQTFFEKAAALPMFDKTRHPVGVLGGRHDFLNLVAATQGSRGQIREAIETLKAVLAAYPYDGQARARLCQVLEEKGQWRDFADCLQEWSAYFPQFLPVYIRRANLLLRLGRHSEAKQVIEDGLRLAPTNVSLKKLKVRVSQNIRP